MTFERFAARYLAWKALRRRRPATLQQDGRALQRFADFARRQGIQRPTDVTARLRERWIDRRLTDGAASSTINKEVRHLRAAWSWAARMGLLAGRPFADWLSLPIERRRRPRLSETACLALLAATTDDPLALLPRILLYSGLRIGEALALESPADLEADLTWLHVRSHPGNPIKDHEERALPIPDALVLADQVLFPRRELAPLLRQAGHPFPLDYPTAYRAFLRWSALLGFPVRPHMLRRTYASLLAERGLSPAVLQRLLGHSSILTTMEHYVDIDIRREVIARAAQASSPPPNDRCPTCGRPR